MATAHIPFTLEDDYIKQFMDYRKINVEGAYHNILDHLLITLKNLFVGPVILQTLDGKTLNLDYITNEIKSKTTAQYIDATNTNNLPVLPAIVMDLHPRVVRNVNQKSEICYKNLKESIGQIYALPTEENIPDGDIHQLTSILKDLKSKNEHSKTS